MLPTQSATGVVTMGSVMQSRVLIVDDDRDMVESLEKVLSADGHACELAPNAASAIRTVDQMSCDVVVSDVLMDGMSGLELLDLVKRAHPELPFVLVTGKGGVTQAVDAVKRGAFHYLTKPCSAEELTQVVRDAVNARRDSARPAQSFRRP